MTTATPRQSSRPALEVLLPELVGTDVGAVTARHLHLDSRSIEPGDVFIAIPGREQDGRQYISMALDKGAAAVIAEADGLDHAPGKTVPVTDLTVKVPDIARQFYGDPSARMALVGVTGTNGKTSVVDYIAQMLRDIGVAAGSIGTLGPRLDSAVVTATNTTPDVVSLNRQLASWLESGVDHVAMEVSSHALDQGRLEGLTFHTAIFTNLSRDHLDYHGDEQAYANAKLGLFERFPLSRALFNDDDPVARTVRQRAHCPALGVSLENPESDVYVQILKTRPLTLRIHSPLGTGTLSADLSGTFNAFNLAVAIMTIATMGYPFERVLAAAPRVKTVPGRMQAIPNNLGIRVVVDYAHTPDALERALTALRPETEGRLIVVVGCGGDRDRGKRALMGEIADRLADTLVITNDNPRSEAPADIAGAIQEGANGNGEIILNRAEAIAQAITGANAGDTVLIAGKGHEDYQEANGVRQPFSDVAVATQCLERAEEARGGQHD